MVRTDSTFGTRYTVACNSYLNDSALQFLAIPTIAKKWSTTLAKIGTNKIKSFPTLNTVRTRKFFASRKFLRLPY